MVSSLLLTCLLAGTEPGQVQVVTSQGQPTLVTEPESSSWNHPTFVIVGESRTGVLKSLDRTRLIVQSDTGEAALPFNQLLQVHFHRSESQVPDLSKGILATLVDGSRVTCRTLEIQSGQAHLATQSLSTLQLPATSIRSLRLSRDDSSLNEAWQALCRRSFDNDVLVVRKQTEQGAVLDHLQGVAGSIQKGSLQFLIDNDAVPIALSKVFGIIYFRQRAKTSAALCALHLRNDDRVYLADVAWDGQQLGATSLLGTRVTVPVDQVQSLDCATANVRYLSAMEPRGVHYTPYFDITWKYRRDRNLDGDPLHMEGKTFARGLCIHSKTVLQFPLAGAYRRFLAVAGIDQAVRPLGDVHLKMTGDGRSLLETDVRGSDSSQMIDLDVAGVRTLEITVDFGSDMDIADHLDLADAKVVK